MVEKPRKRPRVRIKKSEPLPNRGSKNIYPRMVTREIPQIIWEPVYGVITDNGNYLFYRRAVRSRNVFWTARSRPAKKDGLYYMPDVFHKIMGWVYISHSGELKRLPKPVWGSAKSYVLPRVRMVDDTTIDFAINELQKAAKNQML